MEELSRECQKLACVLYFKANAIIISNKQTRTHTLTKHTFVVWNKHLKDIENHATSDD